MALFSTRSVKEGFKNLTRTPWLSTTAIIVLIVSLASAILVGSFRVGVSYVIKRADQQVGVVATLRTTITSPTDIANAQKKIQEIPGVKSVQFKDKETAANELRETPWLKDDTFADIGGNPLQDSFTIRAIESSKYASIAEALRGDSFNYYFDKDTDIIIKTDVIDKLNKLYRYVNIAGIAVTVIFALISILVITNIMRISIHHFKDEISIMRLVGATNSYIQSPFTMQGAMFSIIASIFVSAIALPVFLFYLVPQLQKQAMLDIDQVSQLKIDLLVVLLGSILITVVFSAFTAYITTKRYLKL